VAACALGSLAVPAGAQGADLFAVVGPDFNISLRDAQGVTVTQLDPGPYRIFVEDRSDFHNFHLFGPGVDRLTAVEQLESVVCVTGSSAIRTPPTCAGRSPLETRLRRLRRRHA
jgi:hypothetical protein